MEAVWVTALLTFFPRGMVVWIGFFNDTATTEIYTLSLHDALPIWESELTTSKKAVYQTTYEVLIGLCKVLAPISPFIAEEIYRNLTGEESVHLADYPKYNKELINEKIEKRMDLVRDLISLGRNAREETKIKVRQPISEVILDGKNKKIISDLTPLIEEELTKLTTEDKLKLKDGNEITIKLDNEEFTVTPEMIEIRVESKEGFNASYEGNNFIVLNTTLTNELINEGLARETVSKIQQIRKNNNFDITDRVVVYFESDKEYEEKVKDFVDFIKEETLAVEFSKKTNLTDEYDINEFKVKFKVEKK